MVCNVFMILKDLFHTTLELFMYFFICFLPLLPMYVTLASLAVPVQVKPNNFLEQLRLRSLKAVVALKQCQHIQCSQRMLGTIPFKGITFKRYRKGSLNYIFNTFGAESTRPFSVWVNIENSFLFLRQMPHFLEALL